MEEILIKAVILAGGSGTRLWPLSRAGQPKQFLNLNGQETMLQSTFRRLDPLDISSSVTICNHEHRFFVAEQLREIDKLGSILLEPVGKNTAPAIALAALTTEEDPLLLVLAADHIIQDQEAFVEAVNQAIPIAQDGNLVTFGIVPKEAHTGYGYIKKGSKIDCGFVVDSFTEKPSIDVASEYFESDSYLWNSGIFLFKSSRYLEELKKFRPDILKLCIAAVDEIEVDLDFLRINEDLFSKCPSESIDVAVMEKTQDAVVIPLDASWSDIGSWSSLWNISKKDEVGNVTSGDVILHNAKNCYAKSDDRLVALLGVDNLVVVDTKDALMVAHRDSVQDARIIAQQLKDDGRSEWDLHREVNRPWGKYDTVDAGSGYKVKRITVRPGAKLSVQLHHKRAEHWVVVSGTAKITNGNKTSLLQENESTYIPTGVIHALENPSNENLEIIEVQTGTYLGEDDIVRLEDIYGRLENSSE